MGRKTIIVIVSSSRGGATSPSTCCAHTRGKHDPQFDIGLKHYSAIRGQFALTLGPAQ